MTTISPSIPKMLRYIEWVFLSTVVLRLALLMLNKPLAFELSFGDYTMFGVVVILAILSGFFPVNRPVWQRRLYILVEVVCLLASRAFSNWGLDLFLYLVLVKSCFLLSRRDVIFATIVAGIAWQLSLARFMYQELSLPIETMRENFESALELPKHLVLIDFIVNSSVVYIAASLLVVLLSMTVLSERKSREQAAILSQEVEALAADLERTRIARDIHDSLGHTLTTLDVQLEVAQTLHSQDPARALQAVDRAKLLSSQSLQEVRRAVSTMRHGNFNLLAALNSLVGQMEQPATGNAHSLKIETRLDFPPLPLQTSQQLFLIIKEGLTNIQKHSQASVAKLWAQEVDGEVVVELSDNGVGFASRTTTEGFGIRGMRERVQLLEGHMKVHSSQAQGTFIQVTLPL